MSDFSIRKQARLRREYLYRKSIEEKHAAIQQRKDTIKKSIENEKEIPTHLRAKAVGLMEAGAWDDEGPRLAMELGGEAADVDDEYRFAGVEDPKIVVTTSRDPSSKLKQFAKEIKLLLPNSQRMNRGGHDNKALIEACKANEVTDFVILHETRGQPDGLIVCHLPFGPTAYFTLADVVMRHDIAGIETMSEQFPHLIFHNFKTKLAERTVSILKYLFPVPKDESKRIVSFTNLEDWIIFRQHTYKKKPDSKEHAVTEIGPRFSMKLYKIIRGTLENEAASDLEFILKPYMNTVRKRKFFSDESPW